MTSAGRRMGNHASAPALPLQLMQEASMKGIFAWLIGIPIPIIILLYVFDVF